MGIGTAECESCPIRGISSLCHFSKCIEASNILASFLLVLALVAGIMESLQCQPKRCFPFFTRRRQWHPTRQFCLDRKWRKGLNRREFNERITLSGLSRFQGSVTVESYKPTSGLKEKRDKRLLNPRESYSYRRRSCRRSYGLWNKENGVTKTQRELEPQKLD